MPEAIDKRYVAQIKATIQESCEGATHIICQNSQFRRSLKVMTAINLGVKYIVNAQWLEDSASAGHPIDLEDAKASKKYIVYDSEKEKLYNFSLRATLNLKRGPGGISLFNDIIFFVTDGKHGRPLFNVFIYFPRTASHSTVPC